MSETTTIETTGAACPHCEVCLTIDEVKRIWANYTAGLRHTMGAPEKRRRPCQSCGMVLASAREAWSHCRIPRDLDADQMLPYILGRMPPEVAPGLSSRYASLDGLRDAIARILPTVANKNIRRQLNWYAGYVDRAIRKVQRMVA